MSLQKDILSFIFTFEQIMISMIFNDEYKDKISSSVWHFFLVTLVMVLFFTQCSPVKKDYIIKPMKEFSEDKVSLQRSEITLPVLIPISELQNALNKIVGDSLYHSALDDSFKVIAKKAEEIVISFDGDYFYYDVYIKLNVSKNTFVANFKGDGEIKLKFRTSIEFFEDWSIKSYTDLVEHKWIASPRLNILPGIISLESIATAFLKKNTQSIVNEIDNSLTKSLNLKEIAETIWNDLQIIRSVSDDFPVYSVFQPDSIAMSELSNKEGDLSFVFNLTGYPFFVLQEDTTLIKNIPLPNINLDCAHTDGVNMNIEAQLDYAQMSTIAYAYLKDETFSNLGHSVSIDSINIFPKGDALIIDMALQGDFEGTIYLEGKPVYSPGKSELRLMDVKFDAHTESFLQKRFVWLLKNTFRKKIEDKMVFPIGDKILYLKEQVNSLIKNYSIIDGVVLNANVEGLEFDKLFLLEKSLICRMKLNGQAQIHIKELNF